MSPPQLEWTQANPFSIALDVNNDIWNAGHVNDILAIGLSVIAACDTGGVWMINPGPPDADQFDRYPAVCLSNDWLQDGMSCLAFGPDDQTQVFAGTYQGPTIYAMAFKVQSGEVQWVKTSTITLPGWAGGVAKLVVQKQPRRIIAACSYGVFWSVVPTPFDQVLGYQWTQASGLPSGGYTGLALGSGSSLVVAAGGSNVVWGLYGLFIGTWDPLQIALAFKRSTINGSDPTQMLRTSVASCAGNRSVMYAVGGAASGGIYNVLNSQDGGLTWSTAEIPAGAGGQEDWNNCIAVHPSNYNLVAVGWRDGPFLSKDGANTWSLVTHGPGWHTDLHAVLFPGLESDPSALFVGSDGGIALVSGTGGFNTAYNMHMLNLQIYHFPNIGSGSGTGSQEFPGLYAAGTQDNGNMYCVVDVNAAPEKQPWFELEGGDGGTNRFLSTGHLLRFNNTLKDCDSCPEWGNRVRVQKWDPATASFTGAIRQVILVDGTKDGLPTPVLEIVSNPLYTRNSEVMYAVGGGQGGQWNRTVYGLFANENGDGMHWTKIASLDYDITSLGSLDGTTIIIGTSQGHILACDTNTSIITEMLLSTNLKNLNGSVNQLLLQSPALMFAVHSAGYVLRMNNGTWDVVPGMVAQPYVALEADTAPKPATLLAATETSVFASVDNGQTWSNQSQGLPASPHCQDLRVAVYPDRSRWLYLGTYGRSLWRAQLGPALIPGPRLPVDVVSVSLGVMVDGGGWTSGGPVPPWGPYEGLLASAVASSAAKSLPGNIGLARTANALRVVSINAGALLQQERHVQSLSGEQNSLNLVEEAGKNTNWPVEFKRIVEIIKECQHAAGPDQELVAGILAAGLACLRGGREGQEYLRESLQFILENSQRTAG